MTVDVDGRFSKHYKKRRLLRVSNDLLKSDTFKEDSSEFLSLFLVEGTVLKVLDMGNGVFHELLVKDSASGIELPVISFESIDEKVIYGSLKCVGTVHYNWKPDLRCPDVIYPMALKADFIKQ